MKFSDPQRSRRLSRTLLSLSLVLEACVHVSVHESVRYFSDLVPVGLAFPTVDKPPLWLLPPWQMTQCGGGCGQ